METYEFLDSRRISVDWLAFTVPFDVVQTLHFLGLNILDFSKSSRGSRGYKSMIKHNEANISILYDGNADMGTHVEITSKGFGYAFDKYMKKSSIDTPFGSAYPDAWDMSHLAIFLKKINDVCINISRLDIAIDDIGTSFFSVEDVYQFLDSGRCVSRFRTFDSHKHKSISTGVITGYTIYLGSRQSELMLRIYDKALEQKDFNNSWVRWELELHNDRAVAFVEEFVKAGSLCPVTFGILSNYVRLIDMDSPRRADCSTNQTWTEFISNYDRIKLYVPSEERTIEDKMEWFDKQVGPTYSKIMDYSGGSFFFDNIDRWNYKAGLNDLV